MIASIESEFQAISSTQRHRRFGLRWYGLKFDHIKFQSQEKKQATADPFNARNRRVGRRIVHRYKAMLGFNQFQYPIMSFSGASAFNVRKLDRKEAHIRRPENIGASQSQPHRHYKLISSLESVSQARKAPASKENG